MSAIIAAVVNEKGGATKTTTTYAIGSEAANLGLRTLIVDFDPQYASLTLAAGAERARGAKSVVNAMQAFLENDEPGPLTPHLIALRPLCWLPSPSGLPRCALASPVCSGRRWAGSMPRPVKSCLR